MTPPYATDDLPTDAGASGGARERGQHDDPTHPADVAPSADVAPELHEDTDA